MKKNLLKTVLLACVALFAAFTIWADLTGRWSGVLSIPGQGDFPLSYNFKADGSTLTGTATGPEGDINIDSGRIDGNKFSFKITAHDMTIPHTGVYYGDSIGLDVMFQGNKIHTTLKRAK